METVFALVACVSFVLWLSWPSGPDAERFHSESFFVFPPSGFDVFPPYRPQPAVGTEHSNGTKGAKASETDGVP